MVEIIQEEGLGWKEQRFENRTKKNISIKWVGLSKAVQEIW